MAIVITSSLMISCKSSGEKAREKAMEKALENASGGKVDVDINGEKVKIEGENYKTELNVGGKTWPADMPEGVPKYDFGTIEHTSKSTSDDTQTWNVIYKKSIAGSLEKYDALLKKNGFKTIKFSQGNNGNITGEKGKMIITVSFSEETTIFAVQVRHKE